MPVKGSAERFMLRIHSDISNVPEQGPWTDNRCRMEANSAMQVGFWVGLKFYPANRITYIELLEVKA